MLVYKSERTSCVQKTYICIHRDQSLLHFFSISFLCNLFYFLEDVAVASYADDATPYSVDKLNYFVINENI